MSSIRCLIVAVTILLFLILFPSPVAAFYVQYEFLVNAPGDVPDAISGAELLEGVSYVDGEYEQYGSSGFGNHTQARFLAPFRITPELVIPLVMRSVISGRE